MRLPSIAVATMATVLLLTLAPPPADSPTLGYTPIPIQLGGIARCGVPAVPRASCRIGDCVCDMSGRNCQWQQVCR